MYDGYAADIYSYGLYSDGSTKCTMGMRLTYIVMANIVMAQPSVQWVCGCTDRHRGASCYHKRTCLRLWPVDAGTVKCSRAPSRRRTWERIKATATSSGSGRQHPLVLEPDGFCCHVACLLLGSSDSSRYHTVSLSVCVGGGREEGSVTTQARMHARHARHAHHAQSQTSK